jgi:hypothetical protein
MAIEENLESWEELQKGQIAELAFERIALAHQYAVQYIGRQYTHLIEPSRFRKKDSRPTGIPWLPDFLLMRREVNNWVEFAKVEVKWRHDENRAPIIMPPGTKFFVLFTPSGLMGAEVKTREKRGDLQELELLTELGLKKDKYAEIFDATRSLLTAFDKPESIPVP